jgi:hypothetical protein
LSSAAKQDPPNRVAEMCGPLNPWRMHDRAVLAWLDTPERGWVQGTTANICRVAEFEGAYVLCSEEIMNRFVLSCSSHR